ncbi:MAG: hypothetical protein D6761_06295 [Candidatus Dadabacteria bacterium]|nr:MAG: hypothetical protein D6761_06295 [Candidatus Dadabacteria bacterium]
MATCINHPDRQARRRCFQCKEPICPACQIHLDHHIFCSHRCHLAWRKQDRRERWRKRLNRLREWIDPRIWWRYPPFQREAWARRTMVAVWALLLLCTVLAAALVTLASRTQGLHDRLVQLEQARQTFHAHWLSPPEHTAGMARMRIASGPAPVDVLRNGVAVATVPANTVTSLTVPDPTGVATVWHLRETDAPQETWTLPTTSAASVEQGSGKMVALTFDGGAEQNALAPVLRTLQEYGVRSTFFLTGRFIARYPEETRKIVRLGHEVGNHTWSHAHLTTFEQNWRHQTLPGVTRDWLQLELLRTAHIFSRVTGTMMAPYWRAPYGETNRDINAWAAELGFRHIGWTRHGHETLDSLDWVADPSSPLFLPGEKVVAQLLERIRKPAFQGGVVLMHIGTQRRSQRVDAHLGELLQGLRAAGIRPVTVSELLQHAAK